MKQVGLSIRQPWAELILLGRKTIEVRTWATKHRGPLWLHAAQRVEERACKTNRVALPGLVRGALVGVAEVRECIEFDAESWKRLQPQHLNSVAFDKRYFGWV